MTAVQPCVQAVGALCVLLQICPFKGLQLSILSVFCMSWRAHPHRSLPVLSPTVCRELLTKELADVGIRLNKTKPNIYFKV